MYIHINIYKYIIQSHCTRIAPALHPHCTHIKLQYIYFRDPLAHGGRESTRGGRETIPSRPPVPEGVAKVSATYLQYKRHCTPHCTPHCTRIAPSLHLEPLVKRTKRKAGQEKKTAEVDREKPRAGRESKVAGISFIEQD